MAKKRKASNKSKPVKNQIKIQPEQPLSAETEKILSALSYPIWIIAIVLLILVKKENKFGKYHGMQALFWNIAFYLIWIVFAVILFPVIGPILWLVFVVLSILFAIKTYNQEAFKIPVIYGLLPESAKI